MSRGVKACVPSAADAANSLLFCFLVSSGGRRIKKKVFLHLDCFAYRLVEEEQ